MASKGQYNNAREQLLNQQIQSLQGLQTVYKKQIINFLLPIVTLTERDINAYVSEMFPVFNKPFQLTAAQLGQAFYTQRRRQAGVQANAKISDLKANIFDFDLQGEFNKLNPLGVITGLLTKAKQGGDVSTAAAQFTQVATKSVANVTRETILLLDDTDEFSTHKVTRRARAQGCEFCKTIIMEIDSEETALEAEKFHNNCSCVIDTSFQTEPPFNQAWEEDAKHDLEEARKLIEAGEAGERTIKVGSSEWKNDLKKELSSKAKAFRQKRGYSPEKDKTVREVYAKSMPELVNKIARGQELSQIEKNNLHQWGVTEDRINPNIEALRQPYAKKMDTVNVKNLAYTMDKERKTIESKRPSSIVKQAEQIQETQPKASDVNKLIEENKAGEDRNSS